LAISLPTPSTGGKTSTGPLAAACDAVHTSCTRKGVRHICDDLSYYALGVEWSPSLLCNLHLFMMSGERGADTIIVNSDNGRFSLQVVRKSLKKNRDHPPESCES
jgi:hypothetical protein